MKKYLLLAALCCPLFSYAQQTVRGRVTDEASKTPVPRVTVVVLNIQPAIGAVTDANGDFRLTGVPLGRQSLQFSSMGYETIALNAIVVTAGKEVVLNVSLTEKFTRLKDVEITYQRNKDKQVTNNDMVTVSARPFNMDETKRYAGSLGDPARMAANFAGVVSTTDTRNDIIIRGNSPNSMLWQLDGLNIPNPSHFGALNSMGGSVSMLNNNNLDKSDFMTSAFPAQYGNALAGVFDLRLRDGNDEKHEFLAQAGFNGFEAGAEGPIGPKNKATYLINGRYSTLAAFQQFGLNVGTGSATPEYTDVNYKISTPVGKKGRLSLWGLWGQSSIDILGRDYDSTRTQAYGNAYSDRYARYNTNITGLSYNHQFSQRTTAKLTVGYSTTNEQFDRDSLSTDNPAIATPDWYWRFETRKYSAAFSLHHKFNAQHNIVAGITGDLTDYSIYNKRIFNGTIDKVLSDRDGQLSLLQSFVQWKYRVSNRFSLITGLHHQYLDISNSQSIEPRIGLKYTLHPAHTLGIGYGLHSQMDNIMTYAVVTPTSHGNIYTNESLGFGKSHHAVLSWDWQINENTHLKTEGYYQSLFDIPVTQRPSSFSTLNLGAESVPTIMDSLVNEGTGRNYGVEITLERTFSKGFYYLLTASLFDSKYKGSDGIERNTAFNMGTVFNVLAGKEWQLGRRNRILGLSLKVSAVGGRYLSPVDHAASIADGEIQYDETRAYSEKQSNYFRSDVKISYRLEYKRTTLEFSLDLQNVTDNENIFRQDWNARQQRVTNNYQQGFFPVPFIRFTF